ncbi:unnamed protein product [Bursaphelenchus okinawaensis]|uniref:G_PROTEIN_RECEP_F1_2 domain-containing protein n=1 Tax=Bursaphelenchus okinawaensis TaxID=465554 RepID=A0A811LVT0_9BILA|nr:unnamed protein product [Bursaphelenchus okinawaensis]CAG9128496.1 unnamed protein product [Bursaphelenchus okinawaensis]
MQYHQTEENPYAWDIEQPNLTTLEYDEFALATILLHINTYIAFIIAVIVNSTLFCLIFKYTPSHMKQYKIMLMPSVVIDVIFTTVLALGLFKIKTTDGVVMIALEGVAANFPLQVRICYVSLFGVLTLIITALLPTQTYYRYYCITRPNPMTIKQTMLLYAFVIAATVPVFYFSHESYSTSGLSRQPYNYATLWYKQVPAPNLLIGDEHSFYQNVNCKLTGTVMLTSYVMFAILAVKTVRVLKKECHNLSEKTKTLQRQLTYYLLLQAFLPCVVIIFPVIFIVVKLLLHQDSDSAAILSCLLVTWIPVFNPVMTICVMTPYRNGIVSLLGMRKVAVLNNSFSTTPI